MNIQQLTTQINTLLPDNTTRQISEADVRAILSAILLQTGEEVETNVVVLSKVQIDLSNPRGTNYTTAFAGEFEFVNAQPGGVARFIHSDLSAFADPASTTIFGSYEDNVDNYCEVICVDASPATYQLWIRQPGAFSGGPAGDTSRIQDADNDTFVEVEGAADDDNIAINSEGRSVGLLQQTRQQIGDYATAGNGVHIDINDTSQQILLNAAQAMLGIGGLARAQIQLLGSINLVMNNRVVGVFGDAEQVVGDHSVDGNGTRIRILDGAQSIQLYAQDLILEGYPSTRDDGATTKALYVDASGNVKYGPVTGAGGSGITRAVVNNLNVNLAANQNLHVAANGDGLAGDIALTLTDGNDGNRAVIKHNGPVPPVITGATVIQQASLVNNHVANQDNIIILIQKDVPGGAPEVLLWIADVSQPGYESLTLNPGDFEVPVSNPATKQNVTIGTHTFPVISFTVGNRAIAKVVMPEDYAGGPIKARFYWSTSGGATDDRVGWEIRGVAGAKDDNPLDAAQGTLQVVYDDVEGTTDQMISGATVDVVIDGTPTSGTPVYLEVSLDALSDSDAHLHHVRVQYQTNPVNPAEWTPFSESAPIGGPTFIMDGQPGTHHFVYADKKLYAAATEFAIVRESTGGTPLTVGFGGDNWQDVPAITTHLNGGAGTLEEFKDQSGNARHASQSDLARQPLLSLNGSIYEGIFDQAGDWMAGALDVAFEQDMDYIFIVEETGTSNTGLQRNLFASNNTTNTENHFAKVLSSLLSMHGPAQTYGPAGGSRLDSLQLLTFRLNGDNSEFRINGVAIPFDGASGTDVGDAIMTGITLGTSSAKNTNYWPGKYRVAMGLSRQADPDLAALEAYLITEYGIS